jgi:DNA-binding HxlR family transcriptional regulator
MEIAESVQIIKALADSSRLILVQALHEPQCVEELAQRCGLAPSTVCFHLTKLEKSGLVTKKKDQYYAVYSLNEAIFDKSLRELTAFRNADKFVQDERVRRYRSKVLRAFMKNGRLVRIPAQHKKRLIILEEILKRFRPDETYQESRVDEIIKVICADYVTIRRAFIDEGMVEREKDLYRMRKPAEEPSGMAGHDIKKPLLVGNVKTRQDIKREYKERKKPAGVFQVKNLANGKVLLGSSLNLEGPLNGHKFMLTMGNHRNAELQKEWNMFGPDKFVFEILEIVKVKDDPNFNLEDELTLIEQIWIEKLQPFGKRGYNTGDRIRQA